MNKVYKNIFIPCIILTILTIMFGCSNNRINAEHETKKMAEQIIECLNNNNSKELKSMFSKYSTDSYDLDNQIKELFDFFDGEIVSYDDFDSGTGQETISKGKTTLLTISPIIKNVVTDTGKVFEIRFFAYLACEDDENEVGISSIIISSSDGDECIVGIW